MAFYTRLKSGSQALEAARRLQDDTQRTQAEIEQLKEKVARLATICQSMWLIISEQLPDLDDEILKTRLGEIEKLYSKDAPPQECVSCHRPIHIKKRKCVFCGSSQPQKNIFDSLRD